MRNNGHGADEVDQGGPRNPGRRHIVLALLVAGVVLASWWLIRNSDPTSPANLAHIVKPGAAAGFNVLLITMDTTRPDRLGCYGHRNAITPHIDGLAARGVRFDDAVVHVPLTLPSHASILTGLYPYHHGVRNNIGYKLQSQSVTLAELLRDKGYQTAAFVSCFLLEERFGLSQGFDTFDFAADEEGRKGLNTLTNERDGAKATDGAIAWLKTRHRSGQQEPFFLWVHYFDPHDPYEVHPQTSSSLRNKPYDAELEYVDQQIGRLLGSMGEINASERTLVVLTTDHGESLEEHGESTHGAFIYEATMRAGLVLSNPTLFQGAFRVDDRIAASVDIVPTVLDLLGHKLPGQCDGISLLEPEWRPDRAVYMESAYPMLGAFCAPLYGLRTHSSKYIHTKQSEYYSLKDDPDETENRYDTDPDGLAVLEKKMESLLPLIEEEGRSGAARRSMSSEELRRLESLGYVAASAEPPSTELLDPKELMALISAANEAQQLLKEKKYNEALRAAKDIAAQAESFDKPVHLMARAYAGLGRWQQAAITLEEFALKYPAADIYLHLARVWATLERWDEFERALKAAEVIEPLNGSIYILRGDRATFEGRHADALAAYERAFEVDGDRMTAKEKDKLEAAKRRLKEGP